MKYAGSNATYAAEEMVDISSGARYATNNNGNNNQKNKILIISIVAAIVVALGVAGFCVFSALSNSGNDQNKPSVNANNEFIFADKTTVSGLDISGKTVKEAKALLEKNTQYFITPVTLKLDVAGNAVTLDQSKFEYTYNIDEVLSRVKADAEAGKSTADKKYEVSAVVTNDSVNKNVGEICEKYNVAATDARVSEFRPFTDNRFTFEEAVDGLKIDDADLKKQIGDALHSGQKEVAITAKTSEEKAEVTADFLKKNIVKLGSFETYSYNTDNGTSNMHVSLEACNGSVIEPGAEWSFNECTGDSNLESNGYKSAHVISEGRVTDGIGGGICQSSTTIYNAAILSDMEIVERYNHKWPSGYVDIGLDATIDYPNLDLKLKNQSAYQMFLECKEQDNTLTATFYGYHDPSYDTIETETSDISYSGNSYSVKAWRVYYKDGKEVDREALYSSTYDTDSGSSSGDSDSNSSDSSYSENTNTQSEAAASTVEEQPAYEPQTAAEQEVPDTPVTPDANAGGDGGEATTE